MKNIYYDAEFTGLHRHTSLISIGMVTDDNVSFYAEFTDYKIDQVNQWLRTNVLNNLILNKIGSCQQSVGITGRMNITVKGPSAMIRSALIGWLFTESYVNGLGSPYPVVHGPPSKLRMCVDCYAYDWILLVDLLTNGGSALDMPDYIYYIPYDLSSVLHQLNMNPDMSREALALINPNDTDHTKHNALYDAKIIRECFKNVIIKPLAIIR